MSEAKTAEDEIPALLSEAQALRILLRRYQWDRDLLQNDEAVLVNFIDAHDVTAFINPDKPSALKGFRLAAEEDETNADITFELKLKSDELLRKLLFTDQLGLLPSHGEELDEEVAFQQAYRMNERLSVLARAKEDLTALRHSPMAKSLIEQLHDADLSTRTHIMNFVSARAPALMTLLNSQPDTPRKRIDSLFETSGLVGLAEFAWEALEISPRDAEQLRRVRPTPERIELWRKFLSSREQRRRNSNRSNRIDAEAVASIETLNEQLQLMTAGRVSVRLVTRAMTLLKATLRVEDPAFPELSTPHFLRHPRLTVLPGEVDSSANARTMGELAATLFVAVKTFIRQVRRKEGVRTPDADPRRVFIDAWHSFESARLTRELRMDVTARSPDDPRIAETEFPTLLRWLADDAEFDKLIESETNQCIRQFGSATFSLSQVKESEPVEARVIQKRHPVRISIRPLVSGAPGPVEFAAPSLPIKEGIYPDIENLLDQTASDLPAEQYLAWALLHACRDRWPLAAIYSRAAADVAAIVSGPGPANTRKEAQLLYAQVRRLGELDRDQRMEAAWDRYQDVERRLNFPGADDDPRVLHERAAHIIELALIHANDSKEPVPLAKGIRLLQRAENLLRKDRDTLTQGRCLAMLLIYVLAVLRRNLTWPDECGNMREAAGTWHRDLQLLMAGEEQLDEVPRRTRAMHIAGYLMFGSANTPNDDLPARLQRKLPKSRPVPAKLEAGAPELYDQIVRGNDQTASLIATELDRIVASFRRYKTWEVIHAPIWATYMSESILADIRDPDIYALAHQAYHILGQVAGPRQLGVDAAHRRLYRRASRLFKEALQLAESAGGSVATERALFYLKMDWAYSRWLAALVMVQDLDRKAELEQLLDYYESLSERYPQASIPHFRRHLILDDLADENPSTATDRARLEEQLELAILKSGSDPYLAEVPHHWVLSTMMRRKAHFLLAPAFESSSDDDDDAPDTRSNAVSALLSALRAAFPVVFRNFNATEYSAPDDFYRLERQRRINNIVYYSSVYLGLTGDLRDLIASGFTRDELRRHLELLHHNDNNLEHITDVGIVHTIGYAYYVLGDFDKAVRAAHRLVFLIVDRGIDPYEDAQLRSVFSDAMTWRRHAPPNVAISRHGSN